MYFSFYLDPDPDPGSGNNTRSTKLCSINDGPHLHSDSKLLLVDLLEEILDKLPGMLHSLGNSDFLVGHVTIDEGR